MNTELRLGPIGLKDISSFEGLLNRCFPVSAGTSFFDDFPVWGPLSSSVYRFGGQVGSQWVAAAGLRECKYRFSKAEVPIGIVGAVVTEEKHRGRGLASQLVQSLIEEARQRNLAAVFLWGSEHDLYRKLGFELCGFQCRVPLSRISMPLSKPIGKLCEGWVPDLFDILRTRSYGCVLQESDRTWVSAHQNIAWFRWEHAGKIQAYAAFGKGIDLPMMVHEWGGSDAELQAVLSEVSRLRPGAELLSHPSLLRPWMLPGEADEVLCMGLILDLPRILAGVGREREISLVQGQDAQKWAPMIFGAPQMILDELGIRVMTTGPAPLWFWGVDGA